MFTMQLPDHLKKKIISKLCYLGSLGESQEVFPMVQMRKPVNRPQKEYET